MLLVADGVELADPTVPGLLTPYRAEPRDQSTTVGPGTTPLTYTKR